MFWRLRRVDFAHMTGEARKAALKELTLRQEPPGLLAYHDGQPVAWCSLGPRQDFPALERSRSLKRIDAVPVWSIVCFYVAKPFRRQGLLIGLIRMAAAYARSRGARMLEAYPVDIHSPRLKGLTLHGFHGYMGIATTFEAAGFVQVGRASETQLIMRCDLEVG